MGANEHLRLRRAIAFLWKVIVVFTLGIAMSRLPSRQALQCPKCCAGPMNKGADTSPSDIRPPILTHSCSQFNRTLPSILTV